MAGGRPRSRVRGRSGLQRGRSLLLLALHIAVPVGVVDLIGGGVALSALSIFSVPFYDWASVVFAVWALLVLNRKSRAEE